MKHKVFPIDSCTIQAIIDEGFRLATKSELPTTAIVYRDHGILCDEYIAAVCYPPRQRKFPADALPLLTVLPPRWWG